MTDQDFSQNPPQGPNETPQSSLPRSEQTGSSSSASQARQADGGREPTPGESSSTEQGATAASPANLSEDYVREQLKQVIDPELFVNIVDLGLVYVVELKPNDVTGKTDIHVEMTLTSPMCPAGPQLIGSSRQVLEAIPGVGEVDIKVVMDPPWTQDMMTEDARDQLNIF
ncbi:MAG: hypothetical protein KatS3mg111_0874 [Pirellulaceae bacterium]|nr:MAG: hypothetical protein KatS3mg111_0874 [Pirellulaceae bacterium]